MPTPLELKKAEFLYRCRRLSEDVGLDHDDEAIIGSVEGMTDLTEMLVALTRVAVERAAQAKVCGERIRALQERKARHEDAHDRLRAIVAETMLECSIPKLAPGDLTASARMTKPKAEVIDEAAVPTFYQRAKITIDKAAINSEFERCLVEGDTFAIPGTVISNGRPSLTIKI